MFALSAVSCTASTRASAAMGCAVFHATLRSCSPGRSGTTTRPLSRRAGMGCPASVSDVICAPSGRPMRKSSPRLLVRARSRREVRWRSPRLTACLARRTVTVAPGRGSGRLTAMLADSPGHGRQTGTRSFAPSSKIGAVPESATFHTGEASKRHCSTHVSVARVASARLSLGGSSLCHETESACAASRTSAAPSWMGMFDERTFSPGRSGTRSEIALPCGVGRRTTVRACQSRPSSSSRSTTASVSKSCRS